MAEYILPYSAEDIEEKLESVEHIDKMLTDIDELNSNVNTLNTSVDELNANINTLKSSEKVVGQAFRYLGILDSTCDCNNCKKTGFYGVTSAPINGVGAWCILLVFEGEGGGVHQIGFSTGSLNIRSYTGSPLTWTAWKQYQQKS